MNFFLNLFNLLLTLFGLRPNTNNQSCPPGFLGTKCDIECGLTFAEQNQKIVGGSVAIPFSWPSQAYVKVCLLDTSYCTECGGTLIDPKTVLTAAHCISPKEESTFYVYLGVHDTSKLATSVSVVKIKGSNIVVHENYNDTTYENDIALLKLPYEVTLNKYIQVACLPQQPSSSYPSSNQSAWIVGWGLTDEEGFSSKLLKNAKIRINDGNQYCSVFNSVTNWDKQICAGVYEGGIDTCQGDSGGPLYVLDTIGNKTKYISTGVVSFGEGCARKNSSGVYTRISAYMDWINKNKS